MARFSSPAATQRRSAPTRTQLPADLSSLSTMASCVRPVSDSSAALAALLPPTIPPQTSPTARSHQPATSKHGTANHSSMCPAEPVANRLPYCLVGHPVLSRRTYGRPPARVPYV